MTTVSSSLLGTHPNGWQAHVFTLTNRHGWSVELTNLGAAVRAVRVPSRDGTLTDVALCHESFEDSVSNAHCMGAVCGRVSGRISNARFILNDRTYQITSRTPESARNGGIKNFAHALWKAQPREDGMVTFTYNSPSGDQGFPGALEASVTYSWDDSGRLGLDITATSDADTVADLSSHLYVNLNGHGAGTIDDHVLTMDSDTYLPVDDNLNVTGNMESVLGTPMDFTTPHAIGERIGDEHYQMRLAGGYDFCYYLRGCRGLYDAPCGGAEMAHSARVIGTGTGIAMDVFTDQPAIHLYTGNTMLAYAGKNGVSYVTRGGLRLSPGHLSDAVNRPEFPSPQLRAGDVYRQRTEFIFSVED